MMWWHPLVFIAFCLGVGWLRRIREKRRVRRLKLLMNETYGKFAKPRVAIEPLARQPYMTDGTKN